MKGGSALAWIVGLGLVVWLASRKSDKKDAGGLSGRTVGRSLHPAHPMHPYWNGTPAVWGGRTIRY